jgi:hypothetical protein
MGGAALAGGTTVKLSVTVTSAEPVVAGRGGTTGSVRRVGSSPLPSITAAYRLPSAASSSDFTSRKGESWSTNTLPVGSMR